MEAVPAPAQGSAGPSPDSVKNEDENLSHSGGRASPPPNCAICLGTCRNKSFTDSCLHQFCFKCLLTWSKVKTVCPLCKQNFRSIIHNVQSNHQYEEYMVEQRTTEDGAERMDVARTFRYSTTITVPRHESIAIQQLLLQHYPMISNMLPFPSHRRRSPSLFRRTVYRHNLWARPLPDFTGRFRDCSPEFYRYNDSQMHRLVPWLNRELYYLLNENQGHITYVMSRILELLPQHHISSSEFREALARYFGERTEHFLHELYCFASTPYDMTGYDRNVQYTTDTRVSTVVNTVTSTSDSDASVDSDIVMISSSEPAAGPSRATRPPARPAFPAGYVPPDNSVIPIETISHSDTDDDDEVMVVGYIKPPQDRTPEIVDLLGSDSDVIVQDTLPSPSTPPRPSEPAESRSASLVKLSLKCSRTRPSVDSESEDSTYSAPRPRRKRRPRSADTHATADTADTYGTTPPPGGSRGSESTVSMPSPSSMSLSPLSSLPSPSYSPCDSPPSRNDSSSDSYESGEEERKVSKRKIKRKRSSERKKKLFKRSKSRSHRKESRVSQKSSDVLSKRKSYSGKGVKTSKPRTDSAGSPRLNINQSQEKLVRNESNSSPQLNAGQSQEKNVRNERSSSPNVDQSQVALQEPLASTSGTSRHKKHKSDKKHKVSKTSQKSKRLKSVVRVINSNKNADNTGKNTDGQTGQGDGCESSACDATQKASSSRYSPEMARLRAYIEEACQTYARSQVPATRQDSSDSEDDLPLNLTIQKLNQ